MGIKDSKSTEVAEKVASEACQAVTPPVMLGEGKVEKGDLGDRDASLSVAKRQPVIWAWNPST